MEKRYLSSWEYNCSMILDYIKQLVEEEGGRLVTTWQKTAKMYEIVNRNLKTDQTPIHNIFGDYRYINFVLGDSYYYYSMNDNPFFGVTWGKVPVVNGRITEAYTTREKIFWLEDVYLTGRCTKEDAKRAAKTILAKLICIAYTKPDMKREPKRIYALTISE